MGTLAVACDRGVGHVTLERAEALNALSRSFCEAVDQVIDTLEARADVRVILISSSLKHFCAGADIREMAAMTAAEARSTSFVGCLSALATASKPVIVAVNGLAAGGGCELVEMCDIVIAGKSARFSHPEITLAAVPGAGGTQRLARAMGKHQAMDLLLTGRTMTADEALAAGLVSRVVPDEQLKVIAMEVAVKVASFSSPVARRIKAAVNRAQVGLDAGLAAERDSFHQCFDEQDFREGLSAFLEKRTPRFEHR